MLALLKIANLLLVLSLLALGYLGTQDRMYWNYLPIPFGAVFMTTAWAIFLARQSLDEEHSAPTPTGTRRWRHILVLFFSMGAFTAYMGLQVSLPAVDHRANALGLIAAVVVSAWAFYRTRIPVVATPVATTIAYADTFRAYGQTARAAGLIEAALNVTPGDPELMRALSDIKSGRQQAPPAGNQKFSLHTERGNVVITIPARPKMLVWYIAAVAGVTWLSLAWLPAVIDVINDIHTAAGGVRVFLVIWLAGWSLGGLFTAAVLMRILRPTAPETLRLQADGVAYDSGVPAPLFPGSTVPTRGLRRLFPERMRCLLDRETLSTLALTPGSHGNTLSIALNGRQVFIASGLGESEREKLYKLLFKRYGLNAS